MRQVYHKHHRQHGNQRPLDIQKKTKNIEATRILETLGIPRHAPRSDEFLVLQMKTWLCVSRMEHMFHALISVSKKARAMAEVIPSKLRKDINSNA